MQLVILVTANTLTVQYGQRTNNKTQQDYNGQFNFGYSGGGPQNLVVALMEVLHEKVIAEIEPRGKGYGAKPGYDFIEKLVISGGWEKPLKDEVCGVIGLNVSPYLMETFSFLK